MFFLERMGKKRKSLNEICQQLTIHLRQLLGWRSSHMLYGFGDLNVNKLV